jgi:LemA protein
MVSNLILSVVVFLLIALIFYGVAVYNGLVTVKNNVSKAWSNIDVLLKQRHDELPKLVAVCERYMKHEAETLERVIKARALSQGAGTVEERENAEGFLKEALKSLFAVSEKYPELKADERFAQLQRRVTELESEIADRREFYNESVNVYNIRIEKFPDVLVANMLHLLPRSLWKAPMGELSDAGVKFSY